MSKAKKEYFVHETAVVEEPVSIGEGTRIWLFTHVMPGAKIGKNCNIGQNVYIGSTAVVGDNVKIQNNVSVYESVTIEDNAFLGPSCVFTNVVRPRSVFPRENRNFDKTFVRRGATIGANATIVCGTTIGECAFIGAGSVVSKDVPAYALYFGNPARHRGWICECGEKLGDSTRGKTNLACTACGRTYRKSGKGLTQVEG